MVRIAPVNLNSNPKIFWFDAGDLDICAGDNVVVETARGVEFGHLAQDVFEAGEDELEKLKSPLQSVRRSATPEDEIQAEKMQRKSEEAWPIFKEMAAETNDDMRPVSVEFLFDGDKAIFYFEAEDRVDFRELVRKLAGYFHVRIDMRQIGVRDEARLVGGLGHCGQELCCKRLGGEFCPVSIRMAKEQDLSLNSQKISGVCGRLMCCLRYELDAYRDFKCRAPKLNSQITTPEGVAKVVDLDVMREKVLLKVDEEAPVAVPLADFDASADGECPQVVGQEAWDEALLAASGALSFGPTVFAAARLSASDVLSRPVVVHHTKPTDQHQDGCSAVHQAQGHADTKEKEALSVSHKSRRRRSTKVKGEMRVTEVVGTQKEDCTSSSPHVKAHPANRSKTSSSGNKKQKAATKQSSRVASASQKQQSRVANVSQNAQGRALLPAKSSQSLKKQGISSSRNANNAPRPRQKSSALRQQNAQRKGKGTPRQSLGPSEKADRRQSEKRQNEKRQSEKKASEKRPNEKWQSEKRQSEKRQNEKKANLSHRKARSRTHKTSASGTQQAR